MLPPLLAAVEYKMTTLLLSPQAHKRVTNAPKAESSLQSQFTGLLHLSLLVWSCRHICCDDKITLKRYISYL